MKHICQRILYRVDKQIESGLDTPCWQWLGACNTGKNPIICYDRINYSCRRVVYESEIGPIPAGRQVKLRCGNPKCLNPSHFSVRAAHKRPKRPKDKKLRKADQSIKLSTMQEIIFDLEMGEGIKSTAERYGISLYRVCRILDRNLIKHSERAKFVG